MSATHNIEFTCDICKIKGNDSYAWARIFIGGSSTNMVLSPDQEFDFCPECWLNVRKLIYPPRGKLVEITKDEENV